MSVHTDRLEADRVESIRRYEVPAPKPPRTQRLKNVLEAVGIGLVASAIWDSLRG